MSKPRRIIKKITSPFLKIGAKFYYRKPRKYTYNGIEVVVHPEVFPPHLTLSTKILLDYISELNLQNKTFLELGCGSGIIALFAAQKGAKVTASDLNKTALNYLQNASEKNNLKVKTVYSNLFDELPNKHFDYILINPPYYPKNPKNTKEEAWFCGEDFQYFKKLFQQLPNYLSENNKTLMILSEDCQIAKIKAIATHNNLILKEVFTIKKVGETNFIFQIGFSKKSVS